MLIHERRISEIMKYLIGELLANEATKQGKSLRVYGLERDMGEVEFNQIRNGKRVASVEKLSTLIDLAILDKPLRNEIKEVLPTLDVEILIDLYNLIYRKLELNK